MDVFVYNLRVPHGRSRITGTSTTDNLSTAGAAMTAPAWQARWTGSVHMMEWRRLMTESDRRRRLGVRKDGQRETADQRASAWRRSTVCRRVHGRLGRDNHSTGKLRHIVRPASLQWRFQAWSNACLL